MSDERTYPPLGINDTMPFGKHKGKTIKEILQDDPWWLDWIKGQGNTKFTHEVETDLTIEIKTRKKPAPADGQKREYPPLGHQSKIPFGKHKGKTIEYMLESDPGSLDWLVRNTGVRLTPQAEKELIEELKRKKR